MPNPARWPTTPRPPSCPCPVHLEQMWLGCSTCRPSFLNLEHNVTWMEERGWKGVEGPNRCVSKTSTGLSNNKSTTTTFHGNRQHCVQEDSAHLHVSCKQATAIRHKCTITALTRLELLVPCLLGLDPKTLAKLANKQVRALDPLDEPRCDQKASRVRGARTLAMRCGSKRKNHWSGACTYSRHAKR
jgi:hypothetical protein